ncbi:glycosyltransferase family 4 protein [Flavobacterium luteum]|uniref:Glycosyltransferase family 4 protein n=1 Tax=Flavobacterium luteum TaxID=2026654 RepID=A0A7J5AHQ3_9FLAO|nr:glycosyltransferase family 4 protein [Flavobacterium luteum]KAB1157050.1 glycosyltransferase family 4 protein [Flavobacterium luteum]
MEEILIISNYYPPEKGAAANRIEQLALKLHQNNYVVSVLCPLANYPKGVLFPEYRGKLFVEENLQNIRVKRLWIYPSNSAGIFVRILSVLSFSFGLFFYLLLKKTPKKVVVQSPPLLLSFISVLILSLKRKKIILNVSDLWPLAAIELKALKVNSFSHKISQFLERFIYKKATVILGQSNEIITHIHQFFPNKECHLYRNYPDFELQDFELKTTENATIKLFYAGLLGIAQGVLEVCEKINLEHLNIEFHIFGEGAEKTQIEKYLQNNSSKNIFFHGMLERNDLINKLNSFDVALVPLKTRIYGSVPSKIFEYSALGIPILYFGGGEGETIVKENDLGWIAEVMHFNPLNTTLKEISMIKKSELQLIKKRVFEHSKTHFNLDLQIEKLIKTQVF